MQSWLQLAGLVLTVLLSTPAAAAAGHVASPKSQRSSKDAAAEPAKSHSSKASVASAPAKSRARRSRPPAAPQPAIELEHLTTHATYKLRADSPGGGFSNAKLRALAQLLRCHHTGKRHSISERLIEILYATSRHYHNAKLLIVAGYRAPKIARQKGNSKSAHKRGDACDFQVAGVSNEEVRDYLQKTYHKIGLGYYPRAGFVHVDVGRQRDAYWIDYSSPGQPARYGQNGDSDEPGVAVTRSAPAPAENPAEPGVAVAQSHPAAAPDPAGTAAETDPAP